MKVFKPPTKKKITTICLPSKMLHDLDQAVLIEHKSIRYRSRWVCSAINDFFSLKKYKQLILDEWIDRGNNENIILTLDPASIDKIEAVAKEMIEEKVQKDVQSGVIRAAITQKLIDQELL
ncbi:MAG: hypothetical protein LRY67_07700 [Gammaproteobacteria bacterium]|nr:hypothetical protein [Gammaproteobacteria bacterium]